MLCVFFLLLAAGWVSLYAPFASQPLELRVWVPRGVEVFLRPPIPCPPPPKPSSARGLGEDEEDEEGADGSSSSRRGVVGADDLADIGSVLDAAEGDWEQHRCEGRVGSREHLSLNSSCMLRPACGWRGIHAAHQHFAPLTPSFTHSIPTPIVLSPLVPPRPQKPPQNTTGPS